MWWNWMDMYEISAKDEQTCLYTHAQHTLSCMIYSSSRTYMYMYHTVTRSHASGVETIGAVYPGHTHQHVRRQKDHSPRVCSYLMYISLKSAYKWSGRSIMKQSGATGRKDGDDYVRCVMNDGLRQMYAVLSQWSMEDCGVYPQAVPWGVFQNLPWPWPYYIHYKCYSPNIEKPWKGTMPALRKNTAFL